MDISGIDEHPSDRPSYMVNHTGVDAFSQFTDKNRDGMRQNHAPMLKMGEVTGNHDNTHEDFAMPLNVNHLFC